MSTIYDVMTSDVVTVEPQQTIEAAARLMANHGISSLIVNLNSKTLGIVTEKDILTRILTVGGDPRTVTVADIMTQDIVTCTTDTTIEYACRTMQKKKIKKLAVLRNGLLEGIVSITDIANKHPELIEKFRSKESDTRFNDYIILLLGSDESQNLEFKFSLRYDLNTRQINQSLGHAILKTLCAFLNSSGGTILVGVSDNKMVTGIENDYCLIKHQNRDGFENHLLGLISTNIGNFYLPYIDVKFHNLLWKDLSQFNVSISSEPAFFDNNGKQEFYVRTGNTSRPFSISEASEYISERWG
jgi:CBS domain-containing protein